MQSNIHHLKITKMKWVTVLFSVVLVTLAAADQTEELPLAEECDVELCKLPNCHCSSSNIPGGLEARDTPQVRHTTNMNKINYKINTQ